MNFYSHHLGDYLKRTGHLSLLEHGIYLRLLHTYYLREGAIPADQAARLIGVRERAEKAALDSVLNEFFVLREGHWIQKRCEEELAKHHAYIGRQKDAAAKRWHNSGNATAMPPHADGISRSDAGEIPPISHSPSPITQREERELADATPSLISSKSSPMTSIPDDFELTDEMRNEFHQRFFEGNCNAVFAKFRAHHKSRGTKSADWRASWTYWVETEKDGSGRRAPNGSHLPFHPSQEYR